jgi:5-deoxy-glucuronate isomerase
MPSQSQKWFFRSSELAHGDWDVHIDAANPPAEGWKYTGLRIGTLSKPLTLPADDNERIIFLLEGTSAVVEYVVAGGAPASQVLAGRTSVFHGPTDLLYLPINTSATITGTGRIAVGETPATVAKPVQFTPKDKVQVAIRGAGRESRQVHNLGMPDTLDADRMVVCEVIVPAGNWSGSPSHKHDCYVPGKESTLEEIYYFESAVTRGATTWHLHHLVTSAEHQPIAVPMMLQKRFTQAMLLSFLTVGMVQLLPGLVTTFTSSM